MIYKLSRFLLILLVVIIASIYLPQYYWLSFSERNFANYVQFSPILEDFIIMDYANDKFLDINGNSYSRSQVDSLLPLAHYRLLATKGLLPDSLKGIKLDIDEIRRNSINFRIRSYSIDYPQINLFPLFESKPERLKLEMPDEFFRITHRFEFINTEKNTILEEESLMFTNALIEKGFSFPARKYYGNPTTRKAFDEGYFIIDNKDKLFHIKKVQGEPFCKSIEIPENISIKKIFLREYSLKEFYAFVITDDNKLFLILYDDYKFQEIPINNYDYTEDMLRFQGNLFYRFIAIYKENQLFAYVTDRNYKLIDEYSEKWISNSEKIAGQISRYIFPFRLRIISADSRYADFYFSDFSFSSFYLNIFLILITIFFINKRKIKLKNTLFDFVIIFISGIFGFIAVTIFKIES